MIDETKLSSSARELMNAAKSEGPSAGARAKIWSGVAGAGAAGAAGGIASGTVAATTAVGTSGKLIAVGALFGSALTVGLAMVMVHVGPVAPPSRAPFSRAASSITVQEAVTMQEVAPVFVRPPAPERKHDEPRPAVLPVAPKSVAAHAPVQAQEDPLVRESMLVAEARSALGRGDAEGALVSIRATHKLSSRALEPEELSIESRALRALGREEEAMTLDLRLKNRFPEHALSR